MTVDLRRFEYALEPLLGRRRWQLEAAQARLGRAVAEIAAAVASLEDLPARYGLERARAARALVERLDPASHPRALAWLVRVRRTISAGEQELAGLEARRAELGLACLEAQRRVDAIEHHRGECVAEFAREESARLASEADREWLQRRSRSEAPAARPGQGGASR